MIAGVILAGTLAVLELGRGWLLTRLVLARGLRKETLTVSECRDTLEERERLEQPLNAGARTGGRT